MASSSPTSAALFITTEDPYAIYSPGDKVKGTANLTLQQPLLAKYVIVSLLAGCRVGRPGSGPASLVNQLSFLKQMKVPYHNPGEDPARQLTVGKHQWDFEFDLPSSNGLPPSFCYRDQDGSAEIVYCLVMFAYTSNARSPTKENMCTLAIKYSPKRSPSLLIDPSFNQSCQSLLVRRPCDTDSSALRRHPILRTLRRAVARRKLDEENFHITIDVPRYAVFSEHMDVRLKIQSDDDDYSYAVEVQLIEVHYRLWAVTRIAHGQQSRVGRHQVQRNVMACGNALSTDIHWIFLRRHAPFRVQPRLHGMPLDKHAFSTLGPSFGTQHIVREYCLDVDVFLSIYGKSHRIRFEKNEVTLLPNEFHLGNE